MDRILYFIKLCGILNFGFVACLVDEGRKNNQIYNYIAGDPNSTYLMWAQDALSRWNIGLKNTDNVSSLRNITRGHINNPPNWITVSNDQCEAGGIPGYARDRCFETKTAIGVCYSRSDREGQILETTIVVKKSHLSAAASAPADKLSTFIHEVGHCLGLQHWGNTQESDSGLEAGSTSEHKSHSMYPDASGADVPKAEEVNAIQAVYNTDPTGCGDTNPSGDCIDPSTLANASDCSTGGDAAVPSTPHATYEGYAPCYYSQVKSSDTTFSAQRMYHEKFPYFTISGAIGNAGQKGEMLEPGPPIEGKTFERLYIMKADGTERIYMRKGKVE